MRVLVTWGSRRGGAAAIARTVAEALRAQGLEVDLLPPSNACRATGFDAVIVGGAVHAGRWPRDACSFVSRRETDLRTVPVWFFTSGASEERPPAPQVQTLMERVGAQGHATFGGPTPDARAWAAELAHALPQARPHSFTEQKGGRSSARLIAYGVVGWACSATTMGTVHRFASPAAAAGLEMVIPGLIFALLARSYFRALGARSALTTALTFIAIVLVLDVAFGVARVQHGLRVVLTSPTHTWIPLVVVFAVTWATGRLMTDHHAHHHHHQHQLG
jgi:menaquinone-dependent protoporphyrinogen oxidase